jgi:hypothetical protein
MTQNPPGHEPEPSPPSQGQHLTTVSHEGRFWDVYLEFDDDPHRPDSFRALLCFSPADRNEGETSVRTATIIIEESYEEACAKARRFQDQQLAALLRSALPD